VEVAFGGGAFAKVADSDTLRLVWVLHVLHLKGVGRASGVGDLGSEGGTDGVDVEFFAAIVNGHVPAEAVVLGVGKELVHEVGELEASLKVYTCFAVLAKGDIARVEGTGGANGYAFFACRDLTSLVTVPYIRVRDDLPCRN
jgi:hypothetical protein